MVLLIIARWTDMRVVFNLVMGVETSQYKEGTIGCRRLVIRLTASGAKAELRQTTDITWISITRFAAEDDVVISLVPTW